MARWPPFATPFTLTLALALTVQGACDRRRGPLRGGGDRGERAGRGATVERGGEAVSQRGREDLVRVRVRVGVGVGVRLG